MAPMTRDIAVAGRLLRTGGILALLFGLALWLAVISYALFGSLWRGGQRTEALYAAVDREIGYHELFATQARNAAIDVLANGESTYRQNTPLIAGVLSELMSMPVGSARAIDRVIWTQEFEIIKRAAFSPERASELALLAGRFMLFDADFGDFGVADEVFIITPEGDFAAFSPVSGRERQSQAKIDENMRDFLARLNDVLPEVRSGNDGPYWTHTYAHPITGLPTVSSFVPVRNASGHIILFLGSNVVPDKIVPKEVRGTVLSNESLQLISSEGQILTGSGESQLSRMAPSSSLFRVPLFGSAYMKIGVDWTRVTFERHRPPNIWYAMYSVGTWTLVRYNGPVLVGTTLLFFLYAGAIWAAMRHLRQRIIEPARARTAELIERDAFTRTLIEAAPVGMAIIDPFGPTVVMSNPCYEESVDLLGQLGEGELLRVYRQLNSGAAARPVQRFLTDSDHYYSVNFVDAIFREHPVLIGIVSDITEQRRYEIEQRKARLAAENANKAKDAFLATVSHEMRTPLYGTLASLELLGRQSLNEEKHYFVDVMESSTRNLLDLINDLLDYSRIQVDRFELNPRHCLLQKELEAVGLSFTGRARLQGLTLDWMIDPALAREVNVDASRLGQVITNLVGNAIKFTSAGFVAFSVRVVESDADGCDVTFSVSDSGVGIDPEELPHLFQPFGKIAADQSMQHGTGLGLAISRQFVEMLGGKISVQSDVGVGTTMQFSLRLPWANAEASVPPSHEGGGTFGFVTSHVRRAWFLEAVVSHAGFEPVRYDAVISWRGISKSGGEQGLLMFADEWPLHGMTSEGAYLLRLAPLGRHIPSSAMWPCSLPLLQQAEIYSSLRGREVGGEANAEAIEGAGLEGAERPLSGWYMLVVDDHPISGMLLTCQLEALGAVVDCYHDPREALDAFDEVSHMLVMTDVNMPHMSGRELATQLKARAPDIPVVAVTADVTMRIDQASSTPFDAVLYKPVDAGGLTRVVDLMRAQYPPSWAPPPLSEPLIRSPEPKRASALLTGNLLDSFIAITREDLQRCREAIETADRELLRHSAHRLRGGFMAFSLSGLADLAGTLESLAPEASTAQMSSAVDRLDEAWAEWLRSNGHVVAA